MQGERKLSHWKVARGRLRKSYQRNGSALPDQSAEVPAYGRRNSSPYRPTVSLRQMTLRSRSAKSSYDAGNRNTVGQATNELNKLRLESQNSREGNCQEETNEEMSRGAHEVGQNCSEQNEASVSSPVYFRFDNVQRQRRPLGSVEIEPTVTLEVDATNISGPNPCTVTCEQNGRSWEASGNVVKASPGGNGSLHIWQLGDTMSQGFGYVFGYQSSDSEWRYVSVIRPEKPLRYVRKGTDPTEIQLGSQDPRIFLPRRDSRRGISGVILLSEKFQDLAVDAGKDGTLILTTDGPNLSSWMINT